MEHNIVFICGALRSGTSVTHLMLHSHPQINNPGEFDFLFDLISEAGDFPEIKRYQDWLSTHRIFESKSLTIDYGLNYAELIQSFIEQLVEAEKVLTLNIHRNFDRISYLFPEAKFIHLIRDPRDVAKSSISMGWAGNVYYGIDHWLETEQSWQRLQKIISAEQYLEIKFEDLIFAPETMLKKLCAFMQLSYSENMLDYANKSSYSKPDPALVEQWKSKLKTKEIQCVEAKAKELMQLLGYALSGQPQITIGTIESLWLAINNKAFKFQFSIQRYGLGLFLQEKLSRLLKLNSFNKQTKIAMNEIDKHYLK